LEVEVMQLISLDHKDVIQLMPPSTGISVN